jgi:hypothetical protein
LSLASLPAPIRRRAAGVWAFRARAEALAAGRFQQIARDLEQQDAPAVVVELSQQAAREEARHIALCLELVRAFGGRMESPPIPVLEVEPHLADHDRSLFLQVVLTCCINETMSAAVLGEMLRCARPGLVHDTVQEILRDEINHGRIGWALLSHEASKGPLQDVESMVPWMLKAAVTEELFSGPDVEDPDAEAASLGTLPRSSRLRLFHDSLVDLVFPGFEAFSIDVSESRRWVGGIPL